MVIREDLGPLQQIKVLAKAAEYRAATPRRPGKGKVLPASQFEGEQEFESPNDTGMRAEIIRFECRS